MLMLSALELVGPSHALVPPLWLHLLVSQSRRCQWTAMAAELAFRCVAL